LTDRADGWSGYLLDGLLSGCGFEFGRASPAAAAAFFHAGLAGTPAPGFTEPVRYSGSCSNTDPQVCSIDMAALHGYRIDEIAPDSTPITRPLPTLAQTSELMRQALAVT
jgi:hypothetical protein